MEYGAPRLEGKERPFIIGLLLTIVTLGIYTLYWHWKVHDELARQLGRQNTAAKIWIAVVILRVVAFVVGVTFMTFVVIEMFERLDADPDYEPTSDEALSIMLGFLGLFAFLLVLQILNWVLLGIYVSKMYGQLGDAARRQGRSLRGGGPGAFFGLYYGGIAAGMVIPLLGGVAQLVMVPWAYWFLQENFNDVWRTARAGGPPPTDADWAQRRQETPMAAPAFPPTGASYQATPWDARASAPTTRGPIEYTSQRQAGGGAPGASASGGVVRQSFECPRCRAHNEAVGPPGGRVQIRCAACGESGTVTLPSV